MGVEGIYTERGVKFINPKAPNQKVGYLLREIRWGDAVLARADEGTTPLTQKGARVYYQRGPLREVYENRPEGVEQLFEISQASGDGDLLIRGRFAGNLTPVYRTGEGISFQDGGRTLLRYSEPIAADAAGDTRQAELLVSPSGETAIRLNGEWLAQASYPVVIDPLITAPEGEGEGEETGSIPYFYRVEDGSLRLGTASSLEGIPPGAIIGRSGSASREDDGPAPIVPLNGRIPYICKGSDGTLSIKLAAPGELPPPGAVLEAESGKTPKFTIESAQGVFGETVTVGVSLENPDAFNLIAAEALIRFDPDILSVISVASPIQVPGFQPNVSSFEAPGTVIAFVIDGLAPFDFIPEGPFLEFTFRIDPLAIPNVDVSPLTLAPFPDPFFPGDGCVVVKDDFTFVVPDLVSGQVSVVPPPFLFDVGLEEPLDGQTDVNVTLEKILLRGVAPDGTTESIDPASVTPEIAQLRLDGVPQDAGVFPEGGRLVIQPDRPLLANRTYEVFVGQNLRSIFGDPLQGDRLFSFTMGSVPPGTELVLQPNGVLGKDTTLSRADDSAPAESVFDFGTTQTLGIGQAGSEGDIRRALVEFPIPNLAIERFFDDFAGPALDPTWRFLNSDNADSGFSLTANPGFLTLDASATSEVVFSSKASNSPRVLRFAPDGDYVMETKIVNFSGTGGSQAAGLTVTDDDTHFMALALVSIPGLNVVQAFFEGGPLQIVFLSSASGDPITLRIAKEGVAYRGFYSTDGVNFSPAGVYRPKTPYKNEEIGLFATSNFGGAFSTKFDSFLLISPAGRNVRSASLQLHAGSVSGSPTIRTFRMKRPWTEGTGDGTAATGDGANWETSDGTTPWPGQVGPRSTIGGAGSFAASETSFVLGEGNLVAGSTVSIPLDNRAVQDWLEGRFPNNGILLRAVDEGSSNTLKEIFSSDAADPAKRPRLVIEFQETPELSEFVDGFVPVGNPGVGERIRLKGSAFSPDPIRNIVSFGGVLTTARRARPTQLDVIIPPGAVGGPVTVSVAGRQSNPIVVPVRGRVFSVSPKTAEEGDTVTVEGSNFLTGGEAAAYEYRRDSAPLVDISTTGTKLFTEPLVDLSKEASLPFAFEYFGTPRNALFVHATGGMASFQPFDGFVFEDISIPDAGVPNGTIGPFQAFYLDLVRNTVDVFVETRGTAPNRQFIVQWDKAPLLTGFPLFVEDGQHTFQFILNEGTNVIEFRYGALGTRDKDTGGEQSIGIENDTGSFGLQVARRFPQFVQTGTRFTFTPTTGIHFTFTPLLAGNPLEVVSITDTTAVLKVPPLREPKRGFGRLEESIGFAAVPAGFPLIESVSPRAAEEGDTITIVGRNFDPVPSNNTVAFSGTVGTVLSATPTELTVEVPVGAAPQVNGPRPFSDLSVSTGESGSNVDLPPRNWSRKSDRIEDEKGGKPWQARDTKRSRSWDYCGKRSGEG
jgi:hypothetical protein